MNRRWLSLILAPLIAGGVLLALWHFGRAGMSPERQYLLPAPTQVAEAFREEGPTLLRATGSTAAGAGLGLGMAVVLGYGAAIVLAWSRITRAAFYPYLMILQMTPVIVFAPILVLQIESSLLRVATITFLICFFPLVVNTTQGLLSVDPGLRDLFRLSRASRLNEFWRLRMPAALPYFFTGLRIAATLAPIGAIVGDYTAGSSGDGVGGLGFQIILHSSRLKLPALFATAITGCVLGFAFVAAAVALQWLALRRWHESYQR